LSITTMSLHLEHIPLDLNRGDSLSGLVERVYRH
jgi:hypothetical protein